MKPLISVIIPAYNSEKTISTALQSMLDQTYRNLEIIVVDDFSTDKTAAVIQDFAEKDSRVIYMKATFDDPYRVNSRGRNINAGWSARNTGLAKARGEYITFQDADDASFLNRIELQLGLLQKYDAVHVTLDWQKLDTSFISKKFDGEKFIRDHSSMTGPEEITALARKTRGIAMALLGKLHSTIGFEIKRAKIINKFFFGGLDQYPGTGNSPLFKREVIKKVLFRKLSERVWPSFMGRGADRDFNFNVALKFGKSYAFFVPMYMWKQDKQNEKYTDGLEKYILD
jgi:glycosyltransferase involved in cell wall biosynthesis